MTGKESLSQIANLLTLYPGVTHAVCYQPQSKAVEVRFRCHEIRSLTRIADWALWTNHHVIVGWSDDWRHGEAKDATGPSFSIEFTDDAGKPTPCETFGVFLARDLKELRLLEATESHRLQERWNAVPK